MERLQLLLSPSPDSAAAPSEEEDEEEQGDSAPFITRLTAQAHYGHPATSSTASTAYVHRANGEISEGESHNCELKIALHETYEGGELFNMHHDRRYGSDGHCGPNGRYGSTASDGDAEVDRAEEIELRLTGDESLDMTELHLYYDGRQSPPDLTILVHSPLSSGDHVGRGAIAADDDTLGPWGRSPDSETNSAGGSSSLTSKNTTLNSARLNDTLDSGFVTTKGSDKGENMNDTFDSDNTVAGGSGPFDALLLERSLHHQQPPPTASAATIFDCELGCFISVEEYNRRYGHTEKLWYEE